MSPVQITNEMLEAGIDALEEVAGVSYLRALAEEVYTAMELARLRRSCSAEMAPQCCRDVQADASSNESCRRTSAAQP